MNHRITAAACLLAASGAANAAETLTVIDDQNIAFPFFGQTVALLNTLPNVGGLVVTETLVSVTLETQGDFVIDDVAMMLSVPLEGPDSPATFALSAADLGYTGAGTFTFDVTTEALNGPLGVSFVIPDGKDGKGFPPGTPITVFELSFSGGTGDFFEPWAVMTDVKWEADVIPGPGGAAALAAAGLLACRRRRRLH